MSTIISNYPDSGQNSTATSGVLWNNNTLNNKPAFYISNDNTSINKFFKGSLSITNNSITVMTVSQLTNNSDSNAFLLALYGPDINSPFQTKYIENFDRQFAIRRFAAWNSELVGWRTSPFPYIGTSDTNPKLNAYWFDGTYQYGTTTPGQITVSGSNSSSVNFNITNYIIGTKTDLEETTQLDGYVSEIIIFNTALSQSDRQLMEGYLSWKWGLVSQLPLEHPYKTVNPVSTTSPNLVTGNVLWLDASDPYNNGSQPINGSYLATWVDKSKNPSSGGGINNVPICFLKGTPILTNQGLIKIENIDTKLHTINNKNIVAITKSIPFEKYIICIEKHSLEYNVPCRDTYISMNHQILYNDKMIEAKQLIGVIEGVYKVPYNKEILYNILLEKHDIIDVNNMKVETLHPENIIAKLYNKNLTEEEKNSLVVKINNCYKENNITEYNNIYKFLSK